MFNFDVKYNTQHITINLTSNTVLDVKGKPMIIEYEKILKMSVVHFTAALSNNFNFKMSMLRYDDTKDIVRGVRDIYYNVFQRLLNT